MNQDYLTYLYSFELQLVSIELPTPSSKSFAIQWRKGQKIIKSQPINSKNKFIHLNETLKLCLKLIRNKDGEYQSKYTTLSLMQGQQSNLSQISSVKIDLAEMLTNNQIDLSVSMFPQPCKLIGKLKFQFVMQLKHFKFGNQQIQESEQEVKKVDIVKQPTKNFSKQQQKLILRQQLQDLNYLNQKLRTDREKLLLKVRQLEQSYQQKEKQMINQMQQANKFFDKKLKIRQSTYEQQIQQIVYVTNQKISQSQELLTKFQQQNSELKNKLKVKLSQIVRLRGELIKTQNEKQQLEIKNEALQGQKNKKHQDNLDLIQKYQSKIKQMNDDSIRKAQQLYQLKQSQKTQILIIQQQERTSLNIDIKKLQMQIIQKTETISDLQLKLKHLDEQVSKKNIIINKIDQMLNQRKDQLLTHQFENVQISHKLSTMLSENKSIQQNLNQQMIIAQKDRKQLTQTLLKLESLTVTSKLEKQHFEEQRQAFRTTQTVYKQDIAMLKQELKQYQTVFEQYRDKEKEQTNLIDTLHIENKKNKQLFEVQVKMVQRHEQDLQSLRLMLQQRQDELITKQRQLQDRNNEIDRLQMDNRRLTMDKEFSEQQIKKLQEINKSTEELYNNKIQRQIDHAAQFNEIIKKQHENDLQIERLRSQITNKQNYISKLQRHKGQLQAKLKMKKRQGSEQNQSFIFKSYMSGNTIPKQGGKVDMIQHANAKAQLQMTKKQNQKKDIEISNLKVSVQQKSNIIQQLKDQMNKAGQSRIRSQIKNIQKQMVEFSKKNEKVTSMLSRYEQKIDSLMRQVFQVLQNGGKSKNVVNKITNDFQNLHKQIIDIRDQNQKIQKIAFFRKDTFGKSESFSFVGSDSRVEAQNRDLQMQIHQKQVQIQRLKQIIDRLKRNSKIRSESDFEDNQQTYNNHKRNKSKTRIQRDEDHRDTFGTGRFTKRNEQFEFQQNMQNFRKTKMQKQMAMKQSQLMKSSQMMDIRIQTLSHQLKLKAANEQQMNIELKQRILRNKELQDQLMILKGQNFNIRQDARKLEHELESANRQIKQLSKNKQSDSMSPNQIMFLNRQNNQLKQRQNRLKNQLQRLKQQYKDKYIRYSQHKDIISQLDRTLKDKGKQIQSTRRQITQITQSKNKFQLLVKSQQSQLQQLKKKLNKFQDAQSSIVQDKQSEIKALKRKQISLQKQQQEYINKIQSLQDKNKQLSLQNERSSDEFNRRNINQLKQINSLKEQQQIINEQLKVLKRKNQELTKINNEDQQKIISFGKLQQQNKRKVDKLNKQIESKHQEIDKLRYQIKKIGEQNKRLELSNQEYLRDKKLLQEQISQLNKTLDNQSSEIRKITKQLEKTKLQINQTQETHSSNNKNYKLQREKIIEEKFKAQKLIEDQAFQIKTLQSKLKKDEEQHAEEVSKNSKSYAEKMSTALNQIDTIRKAVRQAELQIADYQAQNKELHNQVQRLNAKLQTIQHQRQNLMNNLESTLTDLQVKKSQIQQLKKQKFDLELKCTRSLSQAQTSQQQTHKTSQKLLKVSQTNKVLIQSVDESQNELRSLKTQYTQLLQQFKLVAPYEQKHNNLEKQFKQLQNDYFQVSNQLKHKLNCVYTKEDFLNYQNTLKSRYDQEKQIYIQKLNKQVENNFQNKKEIVESQIVQLLNECSNLKTEVDKMRQQNIILSSENNDLLVYKQDSQRLRQQIITNQNLVKQLQAQLSHFIHSNKKGDNKCLSLQSQLSEQQKNFTSIKQQNIQLEALNNRLNDTIRSLQQDIQQIQTKNEQMNNRILQQQFQITRLRQNQVFQRTNYEKNLQQLLQNQSGQLKSAEINYVQKIHLYNSEMEKLKGILGQLKYLVEQKTKTIQDLTNQNDELDNQLFAVKQDFQNYKLRSNEQKQISSLQLFKMTTKLREAEDQAAMKYRRMQEQINRISQQVINANAGNTSLNNKFNNSRLSQRDEQKTQKRIQQKIRLKDKTIQELKINNMNLQAQILKFEQQKRFIIDSQQSSQLRNEISRLKQQLQKYQLSGKNHNDLVQISNLNDEIVSLKKKLAKSKKLEEQLNQKLQQITLKYQSQSAEMIYYRGLQIANKDLKFKYDQICDQLRGSRLQKSTTSQAQRQIELLEYQKQDLQKQISDMQGMIYRLGGNEVQVMKSSIR